MERRRESQYSTVFCFARDASEHEVKDVIMIADPDVKVTLDKAINSAHNGIYSINITINEDEATINDDVQVF